MKINVRIFLMLSTLCFWISLTDLYTSTIVLFLLFGIGTGLLITKTQPLSRLLGGKRTKKTLLLLIAFIISGVFSVYSGLYFRINWSGSTLLRRILIRFIPNHDLALLLIALVLMLGMFPAVFNVMTRVLYHSWRMLRSIRWNTLWACIKQSLTLKSILKKATLVVVSLILATAIGIGLLTAVFLIPTDSIEENLQQSALTIQEEGAYPNISQWFHSWMDNWTDSIIMMEAGIAPEGSALEAAILSSHGVIDGASTEADVFVAHYVDGTPYVKMIEYCRYWHGYLVFLKPLLYVMNYNAIRILNGIVQLLIVVSICWLMHKKKLTAYIPAVVLTYLMLMPLALAASMQYSTCFYVILFALLGLLLIPKEKLSRLSAPLFLFTGMATSYFDFLTYPIATFGVPMLMLLLLQSDQEPENKLVKTAKCGILWCIGFGGLWVCKWVLCYIVCGYNLSKILSFVAERTSMAGVSSVLHVELMNFASFAKTLVMVLVLCFVAGKGFFKKSGVTSLTSTHYRAVLPYLLVSIAPIAWFAFATQHSKVHFWFTNKAYCVTLLGILFAVINVRCLSKRNETRY